MGGGWIFSRLGGQKGYGGDDWSVSEPVKIMVANWGKVSVLILISQGGDVGCNLSTGRFC